MYTTQSRLRWLSILVGPELLWLLIYGIVVLLGRANYPPSQLLNDLLEGLSVLIPGVTVLLFLLWYVPDVEKRWLLLRVWVATLFGAHFGLEKGMSAYSDQGPGIGSAYIAGMVLTVFVLIVGSLFIQIRFRRRS
ncbi:hypothetical protein [uncultured Fibrella sp.]|uniref:hypothetical protein n=1 Tax=uncultured Fibrella sp. TaxID=1284596 RepID=UPI0035CA4098